MKMIRIHVFTYFCYLSLTAMSDLIHKSVLRRWKKELENQGEKAFPGKGHAHDEELRRLQRENQRLKETVEILKKAVGIFADRSCADPTQVSWSTKIPLY
jgi:transposase-like protein